jgi:hypothetical protein
MAPPQHPQQGVNNKTSLKMAGHHSPHSLVKSNEDNEIHPPKKMPVM